MLTVRPFYPFFLPFQNKQIYNYNNNFSKNNNSILKDSIKDNLSTSTEISSSDISEINPNSNTNIKNILLNLSDKEIKEAFFIPKKLRQKNKKENVKTKNSINMNNTNGNENTEVLKVEIKISKDKVLHLNFGRLDNVYTVVNKFCKENKLDDISRLVVISNVLKGFSSIYSIYNLNLKEDEIQFLKELKEKYMLMNHV